MRDPSPNAPVSATTSQSDAPRQLIGLREAIALIVGIVVGAGIFKAPSTVAALTGDPVWMFAAWILGGVISLIGALCYAELATAYSHTGGDYHFLRRAYGRTVAFLFGWARFSVISTGSIALLAFVFGDYLNSVFPLQAFGIFSGSMLWAALSIIVLSVVNLRGTISATFTQTWLTTLEASGLLLIVGAALYFVAGGGEPSSASSAAASSGPSIGAFGLAMVFVLLTYGGWNEAAYISSELRNGPRSMVKALIWSVIIITALYLAVVWAFWRTLGIEGLAGSDIAAADTLRTVFGPVAADIISIMVAVAALTSINATMLVGARTSHALGQDWKLLSALARWDSKRDAPVNALLVQSIAALILVCVGGLSGAGFISMVEFTAPVFWLFFLLSGISLFVLRRREPHSPRPFKVPLYPLLPLIFCSMCAYMLWSSLSYVYSQTVGGFNAAWIGVGVMIIGIFLWLCIEMQQKKEEKSRR